MSREDEKGNLEGIVETETKRLSGWNFLKFNASLLTGEGAAAVYGWMLGTPVAVLLEKAEASAAMTTIVAHGTDYLAHATGVGLALYFLFRPQYKSADRTFDRQRFVRDNIALQTAHVGVDVITYLGRMIGSYYAFKEGIHPALVMTGSSIGGEILHWTLMNYIGKRLGYFHGHIHDHNHTHDHSHDHTHRTPS